MKHFKCMVGLLAFAGLTVLNLAQSENRYLLDSMASSSSSSKPSSSTSGKSTSGSKGTGSSSSSSSSSKSSSGSSSTDNPCCHARGVFSSCNREKRVLAMDLDCRIITATYYSKSGEAQVEVQKNGKIECAVSVDFKEKAVRQERTVSGGIIKNAPVVMCPTTGKCNDCKEYRPSCEG